MADDPAARPLILLDACVVINLYATRRMEEMLRTTTSSTGVVDAVFSEAGHVRRGGDGDDADELEEINLRPMVDSGLLIQVSPTAAELDAYVEFTLQLDDGEAMTLAVALARGATVATDEKKAIRVAANRLPLVSSLQLIKAWSDALGLDTATVGTVLRDLRQRGRYIPGNGHLLKGWWQSMLGEG